MKKLISFALAIAMLVVLTACHGGSGKDVSGATAEPTEAAETANPTEAATDEPTEEPTPEPTEEPPPEPTEEPAPIPTEDVPGGWVKPKTPEVTSKLKKLFKQISDTTVGVSYTPVAYIGSQQVNGTNHAFLCETSIAAPDSQKLYAIVLLYEDRDKNVTLTDVIMSGVRTYTEMPVGGWNRAESPIVTKDLSKALQSALSEYVGASFAPVALLSTQPTSAMQYCVFCESGTVTADPHGGYAFVYLAVDADDTAHISTILDFMGN